VIGPLMVVIGLTAFGVNLSALPERIVHLWQLFIGVSLSTRASRRRFCTRRRATSSASRYARNESGCQNTATRRADCHRVSRHAHGGTGRAVVPVRAAYEAVPLKTLRKIWYCIVVRPALHMPAERGHAGRTGFQAVQ